MISSSEHAGVTSATIIDSGEDRFLIFRIGDESFAAPLLSIREIVESMVYRAVPNHHAHFLGLANLRGQILGVLDLGHWFGLEPVAGHSGGVFLVFDIDGSTMAGFVDQVESVRVIPNYAINRDAQSETKLPKAACIGLATIGEDLIPVVDLPKLVREQLCPTSGLKG